MHGQLLDYREFFDTYCTHLREFPKDGAPIPQMSIGEIFTVESDKASLIMDGIDQGPSCDALSACAAVRKDKYLSPDGYVLPCIQVSQEDALKESFPSVRATTISQALADSRYLDGIHLNVGDVFERNPECHQVSDTPAAWVDAVPRASMRAVSPTSSACVTMPASTSRMATTSGRRHSSNVFRAERLSTQGIVFGPKPRLVGHSETCASLDTPMRP